MADRRKDEDWVEQVPESGRSGEYEDYGWESGQSVLPQFRDPSVRRRREEQEGGAAPRDTEVPGEYRYGEGYTFGRPDNYYAAGLPGVDQSYPRLVDYRSHSDHTVPGPYTGRGPRGYQRAAESIQEDVIDGLTRHGEIDATDVDVTVVNGEVTLVGVVENRRMKRLAEDVAESVRGVRDVHNKLRLRGEGAE